VPFWRTVSKGVEAGAKEAGYSFQALEAQNNAQKQLTNAQDARDISSQANRKLNASSAITTSIRPARKAG